MSKLTIGIYGDSYANLNLDSDLGQSWIELLGKDFTVINHGVPGKSLFHCYNDFSNTSQSNYYNIFIVPLMGRFYAEELENIFPNYIQYHRYWYNNYTSVLTMKKRIQERIFNDDSLQKRAADIIDSVAAYYEHWKDFRYDSIVQSTVVESLKRNTQNTIFIDTNANVHDNSDIGLLQLSKWELRQAGYDDNLGVQPHSEKTLFAYDCRKNHLSEENNSILAAKIKNAMNNNISELKIMLNDFVVPTKNTDKFIEWREL
jgi:hypothetical protein